MEHSTGSPDLTVGYPFWQNLEMAFKRAERNPLKRSKQDTFGLIVLASTIFFPPFFFVGMVFLWLSDYWTRGEKIFATLLPIGLAAVGWLYGYLQGGWAVPVAASSIAVVVSAVIVAFALSFRSGMRDAQLPDPA